MPYVPLKTIVSLQRKLDIYQDTNLLESNPFNSNEVSGGTPGPPPPEGNYLLQEDGFPLLQEDGSFILLS